MLLRFHKILKSYHLIILNLIYLIRHETQTVARQNWALQSQQRSPRLQKQLQKNIQKHRIVQKTQLFY